MEILFICQYYPPEPFRVGDVCEGLVDLGHEITVLTSVPNYPQGRFYKGYSIIRKRRERRRGIRIISVPVVPRGRGSALRLALNYVSFALTASVRVLALAILERMSFDTILVYQLSPVTMALPGLIAAKIIGRPLNMYVADLWPETLEVMSPGLYHRVGRRLDRLVRTFYGGCQKVIISSPGFSRSIEGRGVAKKDIVYLPQYCESAYVRMDRNEALAVIGEEYPEGFKIVFAGNIGYAQGLDTLVEAALIIGQNAGVHWIIIGDGRAASELRASVESKGLSNRIHFMGRRSPGYVAAALSICDAAYISLVKTTLLDITIPAKLQSYLACGTPVIGCIDGAARDLLLESGAGIVCPAEDAKRLADAVRSMLQISEEERRKMSDHALEFSRREFDRKRFLARLDEVLGTRE